MAQQRLTFKEYRNLDLVIFAILTVVFELLIVFAANKWFPNHEYTVSIIPLILAIVTMRWNGYSVIHALIGGIAYAVASHLVILGKINFQAVAVYALGNCFCLFSLLLFKFVGKEKICKSVWWSILYTVLVFLLIHVGHALISCIFHQPINIIVNFLVNDSISLLFAIVLVLILKRLDGVFEDQKAYLFRIQKEEKAE